MARGKKYEYHVPIQVTITCSTYVVARSPVEALKKAKNEFAVDDLFRPYEIVDHQITGKPERVGEITFVPEGGLPTNKESAPKKQPAELANLSEQAATIVAFASIAKDGF